MNIIFKNYLKQLKSFKFVTVQTNKISVVVITFNEEANIGNCIQSVALIADEVIIVDSFSTDRTPEIAENMGAIVLQHTFEGHIQQKNWARKQANYDWVLSLDSDECLSKELITQITAIKNNGFSEKDKNGKPIFGYSMNRLNHLSGKPIKGCGWYPDEKLRLWNNRFGEWTGTNPHDRFELQNELAEKHIIGDILHYTYADRKSVYRQAIKFGNIGAKNLEDKFLLTIFFKWITSPTLKFIKNYLIKKGYAYGIDGFYICGCQWIESFIKYGKGFIFNLFRLF